MRTFEIDDEQWSQLAEWCAAIKLIYGEVGDLTYKFKPVAGIGIAVTVYSHLAKTEIDLTDMSKW